MVAVKVVEVMGVVVAMAAAAVVTVEGHRGGRGKPQLVGVFCFFRRGNVLLMTIHCIRVFCFEKCMQL